MAVCKEAVTICQTAGETGTSWGPGQQGSPAPGSTSWALGPLHAGLGPAELATDTKHPALETRSMASGRTKAAVSRGHGRGNHKGLYFPSQPKVLKKTVVPGPCICHVPAVLPPRAAHATPSCVPSRVRTSTWPGPGSIGCWPGGSPADPGINMSVLPQEAALLLSHVPAGHRC